MLRDVRSMLKPEWRDRWETASPVLGDLVLAVLAAAVSISIAPFQYAEIRPPDTFAYVLAVAIGAVVLLVRRRWPVAVLLASFALLQVYYWSGYPSIWPAIPLAVPSTRWPPPARSGGRWWWSSGTG